MPPQCRPDSDTRSAPYGPPVDNRPMRRILGIMIAVFVGLGLFAGYLFATAPTNVDIRLEVANSMVTLMTAVLIAGVLSFVLDQRRMHLAQLDQRQRTRRRRCEI